MNSNYSSNYNSPSEGDSLTDDFINAALLSNQLISGSATWLTGLTFQVSDCVFVINGVRYTSAAEQVTLGAADVTNPRIDIIAVNIDGTVDVVAGTAAANPARPESDPDTQVEVTFALVAAGATTPSDVSNDDVYLENTEWTTADSGSTIDPNDTSDPYAGTKAILFDTAVNGNFLTLTDSATHSAIEFDRLFFYIKNITPPTGNNRLRIALYNQNTRVSSWIDLRNGSYSFSAADIANYQLISIPIVTFALNGNSFDRVRFQTAVSGGGQSLSFLLDNIKFQIGAPTFDYSDYAKLSVHNDWQVAQGTGIIILTDAATINWDMSLSNTFQVTLGGNRIFAAPTNIKPGYTYRLFVHQDVTGNRIPTFNGVFLWPAGTPTFSKAANAVDVIDFVADASGNLHGFMHRAPVECWAIAIGDETTALTTGNGKVNAHWPAYAVTPIDVQIGCGTAPTGASILVDVNEVTTSIFSTRPEIQASEFHSSTGVAAVINDVSIAANAAMRIDIDQVGSTIAGAGLKVYIYFRRT